MIKILDKDLKRILGELSGLRHYIGESTQKEIVLYRFIDLENQLRGLLGEEKRPFKCWHSCPVHEAVK